MKLESIIVHQIDKEQNGNATLKTRDTELPLSDQLSNFVQDIKKAYYKKANPMWGTFDSDKNEYPYQTMISDYKSNDDVSFQLFSVKAVNHLKGLMNAIPQATGGYIIFAHFIDDDEFLATLILTNKRQYNIDDTKLMIKQIQGLDIDKIAVANFINITKWSANEESYLSFTKGRRNISEYFLRFIGCTTNKDSKTQSVALRKAIKDYLDTLEVSSDEKHTRQNSVLSYCTDQIRKGEDLSLHHISSLVNQDEPEAFKDFASGDKYMVSSLVKGHADSLKNLRYYRYKSKDLRIEFDSNMLNEKKIVYNKANNSLTIKDVPQLLIDQLPESMK